MSAKQNVSLLHSQNNLLRARPAAVVRRACSGPGREEEEDVAHGREKAVENKPEERFPKCTLLN